MQLVFEHVPYSKRSTDYYFKEYEGRRKKNVTSKLIILFKMHNRFL